MVDDSEPDLTALTDKQKAILKVLADADGEALQGVEVRHRAKQKYGIEISSHHAMNGVRRRTSRFPNHMEDASYFDSTEEGVESSHSTHCLKQEYIETVRQQLQ
jgi:hypothetical protein